MLAVVVTQGVSGEPLHGADVLLRTHGVRVTTTLRASDHRGAVRIGALRHGDYTLSVGASGYATQVLSVTIPAGRAGDVRVPVRLKRGRRVSGRVVGADGNGVAGVRVVVVVGEAPGIGLPATGVTTDADGRFLMESAPLSGGRLGLLDEDHPYVMEFAAIEGDTATIVTRRHPRKAR